MGCLSLVIKADDTWFLKSTPPSIPAGENQLHFDLLTGKQVREATATAFTPGLTGKTATVCLLLTSLLCDDSVDTTHCSGK